MQEVTRDAIVSITLFAAVFGMVYVYVMTRHREKMLMLEKDLATSPFPTTNYSNLTLKSGMFLVGIAAAFIVIFTLEQCGIHKDTLNVAMVCLFAGLSLIASYLIVNKQKA